MGYQKETIKGLSWMGSLRVSTRILALLKTFVLARLLLPTEFGIFGISALILEFLELLTETGINVFLIQEKEDVDEYVNTAWVVSIFRGLFIGGILIVIAPLIAAFFKSPESTRYIVLISAIPILRGFINPAIVKFQKELNFKSEFSLRIAVYFFDTLVALTVALITQSAVSLVFGMVAGVLLEILISHLYVKPRPQLNFESEKVKKIIKRGKWLTAAGIFNYLFQNFDDIMVGRLLNTYSLGLYQMSYTLSSLPITEIADVSGKVTFPIYVRIGDDKKRLKRAFIKITLVITLLAIIFGSILFFFTDQIVYLLLGYKWQSVVPILKVLSIYGIIRAISGSSSALFLAKKKQEYVTAVTLVSILGLAIPLIPLIRNYGLVGAGYSVIIGSLLAVPVVIYCLYLIFNEKKKTS